MRFHDLQNVEYALRITIGTAKRVKAATGVDLLTLVDDGCKGLRDLMARPDVLCDVVYQITTPDISPEQFADRLSGEVIEQMADAFIAALADFIPSRSAAAALRRIRELQREVAQHQLTQTQAALSRIDSGKLFGTSQAKSE